MSITVMPPMREGAAWPDVVVISGDLTQRAQHAEFRAARAFIDRLPTPHVIVPAITMCRCTTFSTVCSCPSQSCPRCVKVFARPDMVVISGDLTQRAQCAEFRAARAFIDRLPTPHVIVPGIHDVPLYDVLYRFLRPMERFRKFIEPDPYPRYIDSTQAVVGVNTGRSPVVKNGRIDATQIGAICTAFAAVPARLLRVVVTHHPFEAGATMTPANRVGRAALAMRAFAECGVDLLLSGHLHIAYSGTSAPSSQSMQHHGVLAVSAGTATSVRVREEPNGFNVLRAVKQRIDVERHTWAPITATFERTGLSSFVRMGEDWRPV